MIKGNEKYSHSKPQNEQYLVFFDPPGIEYI